MDFPPFVTELGLMPEIIAIALGGSRAINRHTEKSDFDLFCIITDAGFFEFKNGFATRLERIPSVVYAAYMFYLECWGYIYKAIDKYGNLYDIAIICESRIEEMSIRSTNVVIKDIKGVYQNGINNAHDSDYLVSVLEIFRKNDYATLFGFERQRFCDAVSSEDYWYAIRCLERLKNYYIRCFRIEQQCFPRSQSCPEKGFKQLDQCLSSIYIIDGNMETLVQTFLNLCAIFDATIKDKDIRERALGLWSKYPPQSC